MARKRGQATECARFKDGLTGGRKVQKIKLEDIDLDDDTFRFRVSLQTKDLVDSLTAHGQKVPVLLRRDKPPYQIVCGFRRIAAIGALGWNTVDAIIVPKMSKKEATRTSILENEKHRTYSVIDRANAVAKISAWTQESTEEIAREYGLATRQIQRYKEMAKFPKQLLRAVQERRISATHGLLLNTALRHHEKLDLKSWIKRISDEGLSTARLQRVLNKEVRAKGRKKEKKYFEKRGAGFRFYPFAFDPAKASAREKEKIGRYLKRALEMLEG